MAAILLHQHPFYRHAASGEAEVTQCEGRSLSASVMVRKFVVYPEDGRLRIDNNRTENAIRPDVIIRKNLLAVRGGGICEECPQSIKVAFYRLYLIRTLS